MADLVSDNPDDEASQNPESASTLEINDGEPTADQYITATGDDYADPENKKWPVDAKHIHAALSFYNAGAGKQNETPEKWINIGHKIAAFASKFYGKKYALNNGNVTAETDAMPLNTCPGCKNSGCTGSYCPHCGTSLKAVVDDTAAAAIVPNNTASQITGQCPTCRALNQLEKFCTVCGALTFVVPDTRMTTSVAVPSNTSIDPMYVGLDGKEIDLTNLAKGDRVEVSMTEYFVPSDGDWQLVTDAKAKKEGVLGTVRQLAMVVDSKNRNKRLYPRDVAKPALGEVGERAKMGLVHSEYRHPTVVSDRGKQAFVDNHDLKTSNITKVEPANSLGQVFIVRDVLDTPKGREVYNDLVAGKPKGLSTRMLMKAHADVLDGETILVADEMKIPTWDDMGIGDSPAVPDTQKYFQFVTDAELNYLGLPVKDTKGLVPIVDAKETANAVKKEKLKLMNEDIQAALDEYAELALTPEQCDKAAVDAARLKVVSEIKRAKSKKVAGFNFTEAMKALVDTDGLFAGGRQQPTVVIANEIEPTLNSGKGYAKDIALSATPTGPDQDPEQNAPLVEPQGVAAKMDAKTQALLDELLAEREARATAQAVADAIDAKAETAFADDMPAEDRADIVETAKKTVKDIAQVDTVIGTLIEAYSKMGAKAKKAAIGMGASPTSFTHVDPYSGGSTVVTSTEGKPAYMAGVDELLAGVDRYERKQSASGTFTPERKAVREYNRKNFIDPLIQTLNKTRANANSPEAYAAMLDSLSGFQSGPFAALAAGQEIAATDATVLSNFYNQPTISTALLVQNYQDLTALQYVDPIGPSNGNGDPNWIDINNGQGSPGWVLRVPSETWTDPTGVGTFSQRTSFGSFDAGLLVADNTGIPEGTTNTAWQAFATLPRDIAFSITRGTSRSAGLGPLNLDLIARSMYHVTYKKNRVIDKALYDDMLQASDTLKPRIILICA